MNCELGFNPALKLISSRTKKKSLDILSNCRKGQFTVLRLFCHCTSFVAFAWVRPQSFLSIKEALIRVILSAHNLRVTLDL